MRVFPEWCEFCGDRRALVSMVPRVRMNHSYRFYCPGCADESSHWWTPQNILLWEP